MSTAAARGPQGLFARILALNWPLILVLAAVASAGKKAKLRKTQDD